MGKLVEFKVVGLSFRPGYPANIHRLTPYVEEAKARSIGFKTDGGAPEMQVLLQREPDNPHDPNAIQVHAPVLGRGETFIGFVPRDLAVKLAPTLDRGDEWRATVIDVLVKPEHPDRPGVEVQLERMKVADKPEA